MLNTGPLPSWTKVCLRLDHTTVYSPLNSTYQHCQLQPRGSRARAWKWHFPFTLLLYQHNHSVTDKGYQAPILPVEYAHSSQIQLITKREKSQPTFFKNCQEKLHIHLHLDQRQIYFQHYLQIWHPEHVQIDLQLWCKQFTDFRFK